ncbi:hypothetical protein [Sinomonas terrae]|uniref:Minor tail protein n=1 Tax=Sinomonas terrae TaxID=2908838 RepID=A0ABS9U7C9_9MICC|nr:hypothetical protein [Sinomonas terrae]MCH6472591.1 hypothetical protein [Sinomonas terrae]
MIEMNRHPVDLTNWDKEEDPFYFEIYGETEPLVSLAAAEVLPPPNEVDKGGRTYEYWWTLGHTGSAPEHHHLWPERPSDEPIWKHLEDTAARVYLYFPVEKGWRINEITSSVKYLSPVANQAAWTEKAAAEWSKLQPVVNGAATIASGLGVVPVVGPAAALAAPALAALAKLQIGSVPPDVKGFEWSAGKVTFASKEHGLMQGVMWTLPRQMFELLGGRLTGSVAVTFIPAQMQSRGGSEGANLQPAPVLGHAVVYADGRQRWSPGSNHFVELMLSPKEAS